MSLKGECPICYKHDDLSNTTVCIHYFCQECLSKLKICALCRAVIIPDDDSSSSDSDSVETFVVPETDNESQSDDEEINILSSPELFSVMYEVSGNEITIDYSSKKLSDGSDNMAFLHLLKLLTFVLRVNRPTTKVFLNDSDEMVNYRFPNPDKCFDFLKVKLYQVYREIEDNRIELDYKSYIMDNGETLGVVNTNIKRSMKTHTV